MSVLQELYFLLPEIVLLSGACLLLLCPRTWAWPVTVLSLIGAMLAIGMSVPDAPVEIMSRAFRRAEEIDVLRLLILGLSLLVLVYARAFATDADRLRTTEFYVLALFACAGMFLMSGAQHAIPLYLGLELLSLSLYPMVAMQREDGRAAEAAVKYFVLGALAAGFLLYGLSLLYVATGSLHLQDLRDALAAGEIQRLQLLGLIFVLAGLAFKFGAVPFHMWLPDVYDGTSVPAATYISAAPKIAGLLFLLALLGDALAPLASQWAGFLMVMAVLSMALGNLVAIMQTRIRRMLAYSAIAHTGFIFLALCAATPRGLSAAIFYTTIYAVMALGAFGMLLLLGARRPIEKIQDFRGLGRSHPVLALMMLILMFSMAGVPLTAGFTAKLYVLQAVLAVDLWWLAVVAVVLAVAGAYYYLRIIRYMYFEEAEEPLEANPGLGHQILLGANALALVVIFVYPQGWLEMSQAAAALYALGG